MVAAPEPRAELPEAMLAESGASLLGLRLEPTAVSADTVRVELPSPPPQAQQSPPRSLPVQDAARAQDGRQLLWAW